MFKSEDNYEPLENVVVVKDDCRKPINDGVRGSMKEGELYPYYGATGVVDYINDYITDEELLCIAEDCGNYKAGEDSSYIINGKAWVNNHAHLVKAKECCEIKYLHQYLKITDLMPYVSGTTRLKLTQKKMKEIPVLLPSIELQNKFVSIAEQADKSGFDGLISQFIEMFGQSPLINDMNECFSVIRNGANIKQGQIEGGIPITRIETISEEIVDRAKMGYAGIIDDKYKPYYLQNNDILISHINSLKHIGKCALYSQTGNETIIHGMNLLCLRPKCEIMNPVFAIHMLRSNIIKNEIANITKPAVNQASFSVKDFGRIKAILPNMDEQKKFVRIAEQTDKSGSVLQYRIAC
ncbi:restriction modification system DNA specificity domain protein [Segatella baroniae B14]|uniref:Restriction modification system DNA specificity domain protein n=2 Tax=Segatella baroniae TaxID=305719 RepID=D8DYJ8_9BACT|nr:restriction modification system DNA specificity domain protein [Segatella baroniae B14]